MREAERDRVQAGQRGPDQVIEAARLAGGHQHRLARAHQLADHAGGQVSGPAAQADRKPVQADQPQAILLDEHEPAGVGPGQLAQAGRDPVQHGLEAPAARSCPRRCRRAGARPSRARPCNAARPRRPRPDGRPRPSRRSRPRGRSARRYRPAGRSGCHPCAPGGSRTRPGRPASTRSSTALCSAFSSSGTIGGSWPMTSAAVQPNIRSAAGFQDSTARSAPKAMIASAAQSTIARAVMPSCPRSAATARLNRTAHSRIRRPRLVSENARPQGRAAQPRTA